MTLRSEPELSGPRSGCWSLVTAAEMQALDRKTIEEQGIPGEILMESAGRSLLLPTLALRQTRERGSWPVRVLCGAGNNGGDGFVLVRHLHAEGVAAEAILIGDPERLPEDAARNWARLASVGAAHRVLGSEEDLVALLEVTSVAVDAIFGTGLQRPIEGRLAEVVDALRRARRGGLRVLSVDIPSGVSADTGQILGTAVEADFTVTISLPKLGLALEPGRSHAGEITVARVGIADPLPERRRSRISPLARVRGTRAASVTFWSWRDRRARRAPRRSVRAQRPERVQVWSRWRFRRGWRRSSEGSASRR
jgi:NAD(P)H-hydrate epimerase